MQPTIVTAADVRPTVLALLTAILDPELSVDEDVIQGLMADLLDDYVRFWVALGCMMNIAGQLVVEVAEMTGESVSDVLADFVVQP